MRSLRRDIKDFPPRITTSSLAGGPPLSDVRDGDIWIGTGAGSSGQRWSFQFNASSTSGYKWEFIGGSPINVFDDADVSTSTTSFSGVGLGTLPSIGIQRPGDYETGWGANSYVTVVGNYAYTILSYNSGTPSAFYAIYSGAQAASTWAGVSSRVTPINGAVAGATTYLSHYVSAGTGHWTHRYQWLRPIRIA